MAQPKLRKLLVGSGRIGQVHAGNIAGHPDIDLVMIADPFIDGARRVADRTGGRAVEDSAEVFVEAGLDGRDRAPAPRDYIAASGGIFRDMTIHDLGMARFFIPDIVEVCAMGANS